MGNNLKIQGEKFVKIIILQVNIFLLYFSKLFSVWFTFSLSFLFVFQTKYLKSCILNHVCIKL